MHLKRRENEVFGVKPFPLPLVAFFFSISNYVFLVFDKRFEKTKYQIRSSIAELQAQLS